MPGFFCGSSKKNIGINSPFKSNIVPVKLVIKQCEIVFGIKSSALSNESFSVFHATGFHNIYGITNHGFNQDNINVVNLDKLNDFLMAKTSIAKKSIFLLHCKDFIRQNLENNKIDKKQTEIYLPLLAYCAQQFHLASHSSLHVKKSKSETKEQYIERVKLLGSNVGQLLLVSIELIHLLNSGQKATKEDLKSLLKPLLKLQIQDLLIAKILGSATRLTLEDVVNEVDTLLNQSTEKLSQVDPVF